MSLKELTAMLICIMKSVLDLPVYGMLEHAQKAFDKAPLLLPGTY